MAFFFFADNQESFSFLRNNCIFLTFDYIRDEFISAVRPLHGGMGEGASVIGD